MVFRARRPRCVNWEPTWANAGSASWGRPRPGWGQRPESLLGVRWQDWLHEAARGLRRLQERCPWVFACGLSFGAALSLYLAAEVPLAGVAAVSIAVRLRNPLTRLIPIAHYFAQWIEIGEDADLADPAAARKQYYYTRVPATAMAEMYHVLRLAWRIAPRVDVPVVVIQSRNDGTLQPQGAAAIWRRIHCPQKRLVWLERSGHNAFVDAERERVFSEVHAFISGVQLSAISHPQRVAGG
jgi:carboxylesterase